MLFPYNTDAPLYYWPVTTVSLIAINVVAFAATSGEGLEVTEAAQPWILSFGDGLHPLQWVTSNFLHADLFHLLGNMVFLWAFGLVVEGKLGWWRTALVYLGIGIVQAAGQQVIMLGAEHGGALGASSAIFGFLSICLIWAPLNKFSCVLVFRRPIMFDIPIWSFAAIYLGLNLGIAWLNGFGMSSEVLHLGGGLVGAAAGLTMLKLRWVDCEGWDVFAAMAGTAGQIKHPEPQKVQLVPSVPREMLLTQIRGILSEGNGSFALTAHRKAKRLYGDWQLPQEDMLRLISLLSKESQWKDTIGLMREYLKLYSYKDDLVRLKLAQILIQHEQRPVMAQQVLAEIPPGVLDERQEAIRNRLQLAAERSLAEGHLELADE